MYGGGVSAGAIFVVFFGIAVVCGFVSSSIASNKGLSSGGYFFLGLFLGVIGIVIAAVVQPANRWAAVSPPPPASPPGWYADPWGHSPYRYFDGYQWTGHTSADSAPTG